MPYNKFKIRFYIVGSTLHKDNPRDLDILGVITEHAFKKNFGLTNQELFKELKDGNINRPEVIKWKAECHGITRILELLFTKRNIDFKLVSEPTIYGPRKEITVIELEEMNRKV